MIDGSNLLKYLLEGLAVAVAAFYIPKGLSLQEVGLIALTAAATFLVLDLFSPSVAAGARQGAGFGIGYNLAHGAGLEGFNKNTGQLHDCVNQCMKENEEQNKPENEEQPELSDAVHVPSSPVDEPFTDSPSGEPMGFDNSVPYQSEPAFI